MTMKSEVFCKNGNFLNLQCKAERKIA
jgi:hypothetical protein